MEAAGGRENFILFLSGAVLDVCAGQRYVPQVVQLSHMQLRHAFAAMQLVAVRKVLKYST